MFFAFSGEKCGRKRREQGRRRSFEIFGLSFTRRARDLQPRNRRKIARAASKNVFLFSCGMVKQNSGAKTATESKNNPPKIKHIQEKVILRMHGIKRCRNSHLSLSVHHLRMSCHQNDSQTLFSPCSRFAKYFFFKSSSRTENKTESDSSS